MSHHQSQRLLKTNNTPRCFAMCWYEFHRGYESSTKFSTRRKIKLCFISVLSCRFSFPDVDISLATNDEIHSHERQTSKKVYISVVQAVISSRMFFGVPRGESISPAACYKSLADRLNTPPDSFVKSLNDFRFHSELESFSVKHHHHD